MSLTNKIPSFKKGDFISLKDAAAIIVCSSESLRSGAIGKGSITLIRLNDSERAPIVVRKSQVDQFMQERIQLSERSK